MEKKYQEEVGKKYQEFLSKLETIKERIKESAWKEANKKANKKFIFGSLFLVFFGILLFKILPIIGILATILALLQFLGIKIDIFKLKKRLTESYF